ncbi:hypothetical protein OGH69_17165 [Flavobacterium sp. MFBS3-15]|uniref:hypothetical protein n=1 Tax=Flavobacterium sp. MFBS3-15 TaxID=2989816 RepID=UPI002235CF81|nr:hypothetical protein [Flavobacterium sp. MFBS3-15]MCW4470705.1 hypothetical protein [Flavobacterium sp. MFBS3-15]
MSTDVYFVKMNKTLLKSRIPDFKVEEGSFISFQQYVLHSNEVLGRRDYFKLDFTTIITKIDSDPNSLTEEEIDDIIGWIHTSYFKEYLHYSWYDDDVLPILKNFGFELIEEFRDNNHSFLFPFGDFMYYCYNDFEGQKRNTHNLTAEEFYTMLDYMLYFYSLILVHEKENDDYGDYEQIQHNINSVTDEKIKDIATTNFKHYIEQAIIDKDGFKNFDPNNTRGIYSGDIWQRNFYCENLKKIKLEEDDNVAIIVG